jgi:Ca-activated chloride channel homolog
MKTILLVVLCLFVFSKDAISISIKSYLKNRSGIDYYQKGDESKALELFTEVLENEKGIGEVEYNLGNVYYQEKNYEKAKQLYKNSLSTIGKNNKAKAYYNVGNAASKLGDYDLASEMYRKSLELDATDNDAKLNLEVALIKIKEMRPTSDNGQGDPDDKENKRDKKDQSSGQNMNNSEDKDKEKKESQQKKEIQKKQERENVERILNSLEQKENEARKNYMKTQVLGNESVEKDW